MVAQLRVEDDCHHTNCDLPTEWVIWGHGAYCDQHVMEATGDLPSAPSPHRIGWPVCSEICLIVLETRILICR
jgi:hypothetical protein